MMIQIFSTSPKVARLYSKKETESQSKNYHPNLPTKYCDSSGLKVSEVQSYESFTRDSRFLFPRDLCLDLEDLLVLGCCFPVRF